MSGWKVWLSIETPYYVFFTLWMCWFFTYLDISGRSTTTCVGFVHYQRRQHVKRLILTLSSWSQHRWFFFNKSFVLYVWLEVLLGSWTRSLMLVWIFRNSGLILWNPSCIDWKIVMMRKIAKQFGLVCLCCVGVVCFVYLLRFYVKRFYPKRSL